uniref:Cytochrome P450 n=1 Tax=Chromera velia CCMP2878 TaxID=1169474 RepID=A0A0G4EZR5_9ALVE|eukprot:Cvel_14318.t1-p1 / transcript=Cvel_14318.t1 / gene=Cvel_14318 / organism=Chromera_velia_CCMP2878 / gene_product=Cytochrome P450 315a1, mitochondrial, putative / transcript_product=Cytochrome P450 315a1, mitochondrial, putative / location=Cvel_scaffold1012:58413-60002(+) / protein_length=530 / sequence_SO=supercontig / SO=protein_coding / is_pseudo=false
MGAKEVLVAVGAALGLAGVAYGYRQLQKKRKGRKALPKISVGLYEVTKNFTGPQMPQYLLHLSRTQPTVAVLPFPSWNSTVLCSDPQAARVIFAKCGKSRRFYGVLDRFMQGSSLFTDPRPKPTQRKDLLRAFDSQSIEHFQNVSASLSREWLATRSGVDQDFDLCQDMLVLSLRTVLKAGFDNDMSVAEAETLLEQSHQVMDEALRQAYNPIRYLLCRMKILVDNARVDREAGKALAVVEAMIEECRKKCDQENARQQAPVAAALFTSKAYEGRDEKARLRDAVIVLLAAHDTTAFQVCWCVNDLAQHPEIQNELRKQLRSCDESRWTAEVPLLNAVVKESQRLHSVAVAVFREALEDLELLSGHVVESGSTVILDLFSSLRNPQYFEKPDEYVPHRWMGSAEETRKLNAAFIPFTTGLRSCIGQSLAAVQLRSLIGCLVRDFTIERTREPVPRHSLTLEPRGLRIKLNPVAQNKDSPSHSLSLSECEGRGRRGTEAPNIASRTVTRPGSLSPSGSCRSAVGGRWVDQD